MLMTATITHPFDRNNHLVMVSPTHNSFFTTADQQQQQQPMSYMTSAFNLSPAQLVASPHDPPMSSYMPLDFSPLAAASTPGPSPPGTAAFDGKTPGALAQSDYGSPPADVKMLVTTHCDSIVQAAHSCRQSFVDRSDPLDAQDWLDQMRSALDFVENLITPEVEALTATLPPLPRIKREHTSDFLHPLSRHPSPPYDSSHNDSSSRKRCASTLDEDRAPKMIKLEPSPPLAQGTILPPPLVNGFPGSATPTLVPAPTLISAVTIPAAAIAPAASIISPITSLPLHSLPLPLSLSMPESSESNVVTPTNSTIPLPFPPSAGSSTTSFPIGVRASRSSSNASLHMPPSLYPPGPGSAHPLSSSEEYKYYSAPQSPEPQDEDSDEDDEPAPVRPSRSTRGNSHRRGYSDSNLNSANEVPAELRPEVDRIFFEFLNRICSNLDSTDAKGELIHQTLMAKKMQRLDESPDYRPFKFRIQAFTNAFLEELARQGYPEDKIPMKKIRHYLWNQPHISRFNEDGKKTKSKGNHIWNIEARKAPSLNDRGPPKWSFRQFSPKISGTPPSIAYVGLRWSWSPKVWDPQAARQSMDVEWRTIKTLSWLVLEEGLLHGVPTPASESGDVTVAAVFTQEGRELQLTHSFHLTVAPMSGSAEGSYTSKSRRPSLAADSSRRGVSDTAVPSMSAQRPTTGRIAAAQAQAAAAAAGGHVGPPGDQVMQVVQQAAKRLTNAVAHSVQVVISEHSHDPSSPQSQNAEAQAMSLMKQQQVLTTTAKAFDEEALIAGGAAVLDSSLSSVIVAAAQQIVHTAALQVVADNAALAETMQVPATQPTLNEVSVATQSAVAKAVEVTGSKASDVEVLMTASAMIKEQARGSHSIAALANSGVVSVAAVAAGLGTDVIRPHSTGSIPGPASYGAPVYMQSGAPSLTSSLAMELDGPKSMSSGPSQF